MAAFTTAITERNDSENRRVFTIDGSTTLSPRLLIQKRKEGSATGIASDTLSVIYGTADSNGVQLESKVVFEVNVRRPNNGLAADVAAAKVVYLDFVNSDEFAQMVLSQDYVQ